MNTKERTCRVALINPLGAAQTRIAMPPFGLASLIKYYRGHGANSERTQFRILDENATRIDTISELRRWQPSIVGIGTMSPTKTRACELACEVRRCLPEALIIGGGVHFQICPDDGLSSGMFDATCTGEGEETLRGLIDSSFFGGGGRHGFPSIPNLVWFDNDKGAEQSAHWMLNDLEHMPLPDHECFHLPYYFGRRQFVPGVWARSATILSSRGCPFRCSFCFNSFRQGHVRYYDIAKVVRQILELRKQHGIRHINIAEDLFFMNRSRVREFCEQLLQHSADIQWTCNARPSILQESDGSLLELMRKSGCIQMSFGFESASDEVLTRIKGRDATAEKNQRAIDVAYAVGIPVFGYFMCGIPGETEAQMMMTAAFIERNFHKMRHFEYFIYTPFPGAELSRDVEAQGLLEGVTMEDLALNMFSQGKPRVFNACVSAEKVLRLRQELKRKVMAKYAWRDKARWLISESLDNPVRTLRRLGEMYWPKRYNR